MSKSIQLISIIIIPLILIFASCKKNAQNVQNQGEPTSGDGFVQATIDGKILTIVEQEHQYNTLSGEINGINNNELSIYAATLASRSDYRTISFTLKDENPIKHGTYNIVFREIPGVRGYGSSEQLILFSQRKEENGKLVHANFAGFQYEPPYPEAKVTITKFTNKKGEYIEGTFSIISGMINDNGKRVSLTDGKFRVQLK